MSFNNFDN